MKTQRADELLALGFQNVSALQILMHVLYHKMGKFHVAYKRMQQPYCICTYRKEFLRSHAPEYRSLDIYRLHRVLQIEGCQTFVESVV